MYTNRHEPLLTSSFRGTGVNCSIAVESYNGLGYYEYHLPGSNHNQQMSERRVHMLIIVM